MNKGYHHASTSLNKGGIICANTKLFAGLNAVTEIAKKSDIPAKYIHPSSKQCNYTPDLSQYATISYVNQQVSGSLSGAAFSSTISAPSQSLYANGVANVVTLNGAQSFTSNEFFYVNYSTTFSINLTISDGVYGESLALIVYYGSRYSNYAHASSKTIFTKNQWWTNGNQTWTLDASSLLVNLKETILYENNMQIGCYFVYGGNVSGVSYTIHRVSWNISGVRFNE